MIPSTLLPWPLKRSGLYADYSAWFRHELRGWVKSILLDPRTLDRGYWDANALRQMVQEHQQGRPTTKQIAALISLELWHRMYQDNVYS
jgi:asparagine synthase (glutamine-hydrolysing)